MNLSSKAQPVVLVLKGRERLQVWFCPKGDAKKLAGTVNVGLAADARRYGQDLVNELVERALWMAERHAVKAGDAR